MLHLMRGKLLLGGLALTLFAKAATSFPILPSPSDGMADTSMIVNVAASQDEAPETNENTPPPVVPGLALLNKTCETPEEVLHSLSAERELVRGQQGELEIRRSELALAREKLDIEKTALLELKDSIEQLLAKVEAQQTDDLQRLIGFYKNMKPNDAARIMDDLDIETTIMVMGTMKPRVAAPILAKMAPVRARAISKIILERSQLPADQDLVGIRLK